MVDTTGEDSKHSHKLFITSWDGRLVHVHPFKGFTSFDVGHDQHYAGLTEPAPSGVRMFTSFNDCHEHVLQETTGPAIP